MASLVIAPIDVSADAPAPIVSVVQGRPNTFSVQYRVVNRELLPNDTAYATITFLEKGHRFPFNWDGTWLTHAFMHPLFEESTPFFDLDVTFVARRPHRLVARCMLYVGGLKGVAEREILVKPG
jgi:hypothetical protein